MQYTPRAVMAYYILGNRRRSRELIEEAGVFRAAQHANKKQFQKFLKEMTSDG